MSSSNSSVTRYRPAILVLTGAATACVAYLVYNSLQPSTSEGLHRSNAVRRPHARPRPRTSQTARIIQRLQHDAHPLGEFDFFGNSVVLDARHLLSPAELRDIAQQSQPDASPEQVDNTIRQLYDTFLDRFLGLSFPDRALSTAEASAIGRWIGPRIPDDAAFARALQRHDARFAHEETEAALTADGAESIAPTELSWRSDEDTEGEGVDSDSQTLQRTLYHIAEERARQEGVIHRGITCNGCDTKPIRGIRWRCANCADFDLCSDCEATNSHIKTHIFYKIRVPAPYLGLPKQEPVYPGCPHRMTVSINSTLKRRLVSETKMEAEEIEALWDQFTCLAGTEWQSDPNEIKWALDRRNFNHAFQPRYSSFITAPNLIYDRVFAYYDSDHNGLIGFEEFIKGLDGMHSSDSRVKLRIIFNGYDIDGDGYISRKDVLRIFRAFYAIEKEATRNYLAESAEELSVRGALETIHSSQPLGSAFTNSIPNGNPENPRLGEKPTDESEDASPIIRDDTIQDTADREEVLRQSAESGNEEHVDPDQIVRDRWKRRQFYIDEEEGLTRPEGVEDTPPDVESEDQIGDGDEGLPTAENGRPRGSRSSSRVRFQDDVEDIETRSNASTSSRPIGERWGGYEIPEPEKDAGKEILYQITQQGFNELLDPLFQEKEDNAIDAFATRIERRKRAAEVDEAIEEFRREKDINRIVADIGIYRYSKCVMAVFKDTMGKFGLKHLVEYKLGPEKNVEAMTGFLHFMLAAYEEGIIKSTKDWDDDWPPDGMSLWNAKLCRMQFAHEFIETVVNLACSAGIVPPLSIQTPPATPSDPYSPKVSDPPVKEIPYRDPTMPQFRPNSLADVQSHSQPTNDSVPLGDSQSTTSSSSGPDFTIYDDDDDGYMHDTGVDEHFFITDGGGDDTTSVAESDESDTSGPSSPISTPVPAPNTIPAAPQETISSDSPATSTGHPPIPTESFSNTPALCTLWVDQESPEAGIIRGDLRLRVNSTYEAETAFLRAIERKIRRAAMNHTSYLHIPFLASLETVEREISDRKGSGLLDFREFEEHMKAGTLRFLESWMDWVSF